MVYKKKKKNKLHKENIRKLNNLKTKYIVHHKKKYKI